MDEMQEFSRPSGTAWHVAYTEPNAEASARDEIIELGFEVYMPVERYMKAHRGKRVEFTRPLFPRYLFVGVAMGQQWQPIKYVEGVHDVLRNNDIPSRVPVGVIDFLRKSESVGVFDRRKNAPNPFKIGEIVRVSEGPFSGLNARIEAFAAKIKSTSASKRAKVLLAFLGRQVAMELDVVALEKL